MSNKLYHDVYKVLWPKGGAWNTFDDSDTDKLFQGMADTDEVIRDEYSALADIQDPRLTTFLDELERDFGFAFSANLTEDERREQILSLKNDKKAAGAQRDFIERKLHEAGFTDLHVFKNDPPVDPQPFMESYYATFCGDEDGFCGSTEAYCSIYSSGEYVVNGPIYPGQLQYDAFCGGDESFCNGDAAFCGNTAGQDRDNEITYSVPAGLDQGFWSQVFFVATSVTRDVDGKIIAVEPLVLDSIFRDKFIKTIVRYKQIGSWAACAVVFIDGLLSGDGYGNFAYGNNPYGN